MKILGIQIDHNSSACLFNNNELIYYHQEERLSRLKKDSGIPYCCLKQIAKINPKIDAVAISGYNFLRFQNMNIPALLKKIGFELSGRFQWFSNYKGHHYTHALKAFYDSGFEESLILVSDGRGSTYFLSNGAQAIETTSIFSASKARGLSLLYKRLYTPSNIDNAYIIWDSEFLEDKTKIPNWVGKNSVIEIRNDYDVGFMYESVSRAIGFNDEGGKMLGLQSYGCRDDSLPYTLTYDNKFNMSLFKFDDELHNKGFDTDRYPQLCEKEKQINLAYHVQKTFEYIQLERIKEFLNKTGHQNVTLTGGCALNVVANSYIMKNLPIEISLYVDPLCGDEGNSIGAVYSYNKDRFAQSAPGSITNLYISGTNPNYNLNILDDELIYDVSDSDIVKLLIEKNVVALFQGKAEAGPRALGNRSILFDPRVNNGKDIVNKIKAREPFRPFGCSVMLDKAKEWFNMNNLSESQYMMYALDIDDEVAKKIPAVVHVDKTCRIQTVTREQNLLFYNLLECFYQETGIPLLLNTSFNVANEPIVETLDDALRSLRSSDIEYLYLPEMKKLVHIKNVISNDQLSIT